MVPWHFWRLHNPLTTELKDISSRNTLSGVSCPLHSFTDFLSFQESFISWFRCFIALSSKHRLAFFITLSWIRSFISFHRAYVQQPNRLPNQKKIQILFKTLSLFSLMHHPYFSVLGNLFLGSTMYSQAYPCWIIRSLIDSFCHRWKPTKESTYLPIPPVRCELPDHLHQRLHRRVVLSTNWHPLRVLSLQDPVFSFLATRPIRTRSFL